MAAVAEKHIFVRTYRVGLFQGESGYFYRAALADGLPWFCKIMDGVAVIGGSVEE